MTGLQPLAELNKPAPKFKVGDWVRERADSMGRQDPQRWRVAMVDELEPCDTPSWAGELCALLGVSSKDSEQS